MTWQDIPDRRRLGLAHSMRNSHDLQKSPDPDLHQAADIPATRPPAEATSPGDHVALRHIAEQVADCFAGSGYAFVEEDKIDGLTATLGSFLTVADIPANPPGTGDPSPTNAAARQEPRRHDG